jgi:hypothetical protein
MLVIGGQTAGGLKNPVVFPAGWRTGTGSALGRIPHDGRAMDVHSGGLAVKAGEV